MNWLERFLAHPFHGPLQTMTRITNGIVRGPSYRNNVLVYAGDTTPNMERVTRCLTCHEVVKVEDHYSYPLDRWRRRS